MGLTGNFAPIPAPRYQEALKQKKYFIFSKKVVESGRQIIGFDLSEVSTSETYWDANVGARVLFKLCNLIIASNPVQHV